MRSRHALSADRQATRILLRGSRQQLFLLEDIFLRGQGESLRAFAATGIETSSVNWFQNQFAA